MVYTIPVKIIVHTTALYSNISNAKVHTQAKYGNLVNVSMFAQATCTKPWNKQGNNLSLNTELYTPTI